MREPPAVFLSRYARSSLSEADAFQRQTASFAQGAFLKVQK
ncbi:hypothetical protein CEV33_1686 [Brucella grignonensis]|uniref:Uncharacterized protein n=1 Tax=Brucella grignonensis TaxID=94627 RepID=A0A256F9Y1_9HYPH|nr:hypothetical protein CEV33_1686 [Brucella grignonensis]